jgi:hypothetical protein
MKKNGLQKKMETEEKPMNRVVKIGIHSILIDECDAGWVNNHDWTSTKKQKSWYFRTWIARRPIGRWLYMHRLIANTPYGQVTHHRNRNSLDNRRANLVSLPPGVHEALHRDNGVTIKFDTLSPTTSPLDAL